MVSASVTPGLRNNTGLAIARLELLPNPPGPSSAASTKPGRLITVSVLPIGWNSLHTRSPTYVWTIATCTVTSATSLLGRTGRSTQAIVPWVPL
jgi:hypothetical protein